MHRVWWGLLLVAVTGCGVPRLGPQGERVGWSTSDPEGCRPVAALRQAEGGGLRSYTQNRAAAEVRLRNEAGRLGADTIVLLSEVHGDSEQGAESFANGVAGLSTPNARCSNCVLLTGRAYACGASAPEPTRPPSRYLPAEPEPAFEPPAAPASPPPAALPPVQIQTPGEPPVIIIIPQK